ncbi:conjugal transfer protein TraP [Escherichia coli]|uniref:conjugal transfer protein TraP n=1 Tax=Escherichia coli TaxID=562 RepID=UPI003D9A7C8D
MANNTSSRQAGHAARYVVARVLRGLFWCLKYAVILPLATMALMALFVLWKDNTTPGKLLVQEIDFVRQTAPAGQFPATGHNGPDGSVCFMEGQHHTRKITGSGN